VTGWRVVGTSFPRVDAGEKVRGTVEYMADLDRPGMLEAVVVRSPHPHARVRSIDTSRARALDGVRAVLTPADVAGLPRHKAFARSPAIGTILTDRPRFVGDAVAAVAAETAAAARRAAAAIEVEYEELPACLSVGEALASEVVLHDEAPGNRAGPPVELRGGDVDGALRVADLVHSERYTTQRQAAQTIEPLSCICEWDADGVLNVWTHLDNFFHFRHDLAALLSVPVERVRVHAPPALGATFGLKNGLLPSLEPLCALLASAAGRPVRLALSVEESMAATVTRHPAEIELTTGAMRDGRIVARRARVLLDAGASGFGYIVAFAMLGKWVALYPVDDFEFTAVAVYTNHVPAGAYRAVGTAQVHFAMESQMDEIARALDLDPVELRRRNVARVGDHLPFGTPIRSFGAEACLRRGMEAFGWDAPGRGRDGSADPARSPVRRGRGMALGLHSSGLTGLLPEPEQSECRLAALADGTVELALGVVDKGQGALSVHAAVVAEILGIGLDRVRIVRSDTDAVPFDLMGAEASRGTYVQGRAVADAATRLRRELDERAARRLGLDATGSAPVHGDARIRVDRAGEVTYAELAASTGGRIEVRGHFAPEDRDPLPVVGAHFCEVEVELATGIVRVLRYVAAQDVGQVISTLGCRGQIEGGVHHGLGLALQEELRYAAGQPLNPNFMGYKVLMAPDMPDVEAVMVEVPDPDGGPFGAKGVGTPVMPAVTPAVANAIHDAVGVRVRSLPITPKRLLLAMQSGGDGGGSR
jgi:xanthine dehydrogenase molybdenum-binding subunit